jgi:Mg/Co/Ni transporter MgtE
MKEHRIRVSNERDKLDRYNMQIRYYLDEIKQLNRSKQISINSYDKRIRFLEDLVKSKSEKAQRLAEKLDQQQQNDIIKHEQSTDATKTTT